jgi:hypothetical protein
MSAPQARRLTGRRWIASWCLCARCQARECRDLHGVAGFWLSRIELFAGSPSEERLHWRAFFEFLSAHRCLSPRRTRYTGTGRQAHWAIILYSVPDFTWYVKGKSRPI